jgi:hypothetical protein
MSRDRAEFCKTVSITDGDRNRDIDVRAGQLGLVIDDVATLDWDWIQEAFRACACKSKLPLGPQASDADSVDPDPLPPQERSAP